METRPANEPLACLPEETIPWCAPDENDGGANLYYAAVAPAAESLYTPPEARLPIHYNRDIIFVENPAAGNVGRSNLVYRFRRSLFAAVRRGDITGESLRRVHFIQTDADPATRYDSLKYLLNAKARPGNMPMIVTLGGDGTHGRVTTIAAKYAIDGEVATSIAGPGGGGRDMNRVTGTPGRPAKMWPFLRDAMEVELDALRVRIPDRNEPLAIHTQGEGVSGEAFSAVENVRALKGGSVRWWHYLWPVTKAIKNARPFIASVSVNGGPAQEFVAAETLAIGSTSAGVISAVPLPKRGFSLFVMPVDPDKRGLARLAPGLRPAFEVIGKRVRAMLGDRSVIAPGSGIKTLAPERQISIQEGDRVKIAFLDAKSRRPIWVRGITNGDVVRGVSEVELEGIVPPVKTLAAPNSELMIRRGLYEPPTLSQRVGSLGSKVAIPGALIAFGGLEVWKNQLPPEERERIGLFSNATFATMGFIAYAKYGGTPVFYSMPGFMAAFLPGNIATSVILDKVGRETGTGSLRYGGGANTVGGLAGGGVTAYLGRKKAELATKAVKGAMNRLIETSPAVEEWIGSAARAVGRAVSSVAAGFAASAGTIVELLPIIVINPDQIFNVTGVTGQNTDT